MKKLTKRERIDVIPHRAFELAATGKYSGWHSIELALRKIGFPEAKQQLNNHLTRAALDETCRRAQAGEFREPKV